MAGLDDIFKLSEENVKDLDIENALRGDDEDVEDVKMP